MVIVKVCIGLSFAFEYYLLPLNHLFKDVSKKYKLNMRKSSFISDVFYSDIS